MLLALPILIPFAAATATLFVWRHANAQRWIGLGGALALLGAAILLLDEVAANGVIALRVAGWRAGIAISLVADLFGAIMVVLTGLTGTIVAVYSLAGIDHRREAFGYYPLLNIMLMGLAGVFLTGDIFNLYVWFELVLIASFVLVVLGGERGQLEGAIKYVTLNLISSALFLAAVGLLYGSTGTLSMADLSVMMGPHHSLAGRAFPAEYVTVLALLFLAAFGIKAAIFPLFFWLPASYHTPPPAVSAIFAGLLTKVGVYALIRVFTLIFVRDAAFTHQIILVAAGVTMLSGVLGAVAQNEFRRILAFHSVSQVGYMMMGLGLFSRPALAAAIYFIIHHNIVKTNLFLVSGVVHGLRGSYELKQLGGVYAAHGVIAALFLISAFSLAGVPPLTGFFAKLGLVRAGLETGDYVIVAVALGVGLLTLFSMTKIWAEAFWKEPPAAVASGAERIGLRTLRALAAPVAILAALTVALGIGAEPVLALAERAAAQLLDPEQYARAVLR
jgi:multicomponent Na+:H+ antiporter subunit D